MRDGPGDARVTGRDTIPAAIRSPRYAGPADSGDLRGASRDSMAGATSKNLTVLIPVFNERATLVATLERVLASPVVREIIIIDDASTDGTRELLKSEIDGQYPCVRIVYGERNAGKSSALRAGLPLARGEYVVIQDADLEYDPADFEALLAPTRDRGATVVYGSRFQHGYPRMRLPNLAMNVLLAWLVRMLYGARLSDEATCYKLFKREVLQGLPLNARRFEFCPEVTAKVLRCGHEILEVPIRYTSRSHAEGKKIRWTDGIVAIWTLIRYRTWRPRPGGLA
jgi:dolichol-phosphate mannosyltransferase